VNSLLTASVVYAVTILVWRQVYVQNSAGMPISREDMFTYLLLACCISYALNVGIEFRIGQRIRSGLIATDLLKPIDLQISQFIQCLSDSLFNGMLGLVVFFFGYLFLGPNVFPASLTSFGLFIVSFLLGFLVMYSICFVFVQGIFYTYSFYGVLTSRNALQLTFSGLYAPLTLFQPVLKSIGYWLPFRHTIYTPVSIYMGWFKGTEAYLLMLEQAAWVVGLSILGRLLMLKSLKQLEVQGG
jgi:ABC-2 type transport system permease protein